MKEQGGWISIPEDWIAGAFAAFLIIASAPLWPLAPALAGSVVGFGIGIFLYNFLRIFVFDKVSLGTAKFVRNALMVFSILVVLVLLVYLKQPQEDLGKFIHNAVFMSSLETGVWLLLLAPMYFRRRVVFEKLAENTEDKPE